MKFILTLIFICAFEVCSAQISDAVVLSVRGTWAEKQDNSRAQFGGNNAIINKFVQNSYSYFIQ